MVITVDGPAGAGKSTVARGLAERLGFEFLDTGAMYRAATLAALRRGADWRAPQELAALARRCRIDLLGEQVLLDGEDVSEAIRATEVTVHVHYLADNPDVRRQMVALQRQMVQGKNVVTEGRDQGTVAFPDAECKIFLIASPRERALRRQRELQRRGEAVPFEEVLQQQELRDQRDSSRAVGPLRKAVDAVEFSTDGLTAEEVLDRLEVLVQSRLQARAHG